MGCGATAAFVTLSRMWNPFRRRLAELETLAEALHSLTETVRGHDVTLHRLTAERATLAAEHHAMVDSLERLYRRVSMRTLRAQRANGDGSRVDAESSESDADFVQSLRHRNPRR